MKLQSIYNKLPYQLQNILVSAKGYHLQKTRYGKRFKEHLSEYLKKSDFDQEEALRMFLYKASKTDFYKELFLKYDFNIEADNLKKELLKLPVLTKEIVKENIDRIKPDVKYLKGYKVLEAKTSGTTGSGLLFYQTQVMVNKQWAIWWRYRIWNGINLNTWCGWFGGKIIIPVEHKKPPYWRINRPGRQLMFSTYHLNKETASLYYNKLKDNKISWIHGYPSQIAILAGYVKDLGLPPLPDLKIITYGSENLFEYQRELISRVFKVPIRTHYGLAEGVANISQLPDGSFKVDDDFCYVEFIPTSDPERFRIIGTNFSNVAFPLLRYDTGDIAIIEQENGESVIKGIDGRSDDYIVRANGVKVARLGFLFNDQVYVKEAQIYQPNIESVVFRIVPLTGYDKSINEHNIVNAAIERLGDEFDYSFEYYDSIPKTKSGKLQYVVSDVK